MFIFLFKLINTRAASRLSFEEHKAVGEEDRQADRQANIEMQLISVCMPYASECQDEEGDLDGQEKTLPF
jgi:hypothetical protein